jgi:hypothetical protein
MITFQTINVGTVANDGTGDPLRTAFIKVNTNYQLIGSVFPSDGGGNPVPVAPLDSPHFTGDPQAPTPPPADNDQSIATTAWVRALIHDPDLSGLAPIDSPHFTGVPTAPLPAPTSNDGTIPTTAWVTTKVAASAGGGGGGQTPTPPPTPVAGQFWYDLTTGVLSLYVDDGNTKQWVAINAIVPTV